MTALDLTPAAGAAPRGRRIARHAAMESALTLRNGEQLLLALVIPVGVLVAGRLFGTQFGLDPQFLPASVLALALWSTSFTSLAITTAFERRYGVLERLVATPLTRLDLVTGKALATATVTAGQLALLAGVAVALGWRPMPTVTQTLVAAGVAVLSAATFASFALTLASRLRAEATLAAANLIYLLVAAGGGVLLPLSAYPPATAAVLAWTPSGALGETLRTWAAGGTDPMPLVVVAAWAALALLLARKAFRWT
ncbi:ABC transporter permease [Propioniciclava sp.]|uniref:ABC transporter permease n=1 Tax=Propioniciclava sp. TaxID=2038686 RepID=UPI00262DBFDA|nr:ABC transporter permease [Propioniciclava sp.]